MSPTYRKRQLSNRCGRVARPVNASDGLTYVLIAVVAALLVARWLVPTESAPEGDTLWLVQLWLGACLLWAWNSYRQQNFSLRLDRFDLALWILIGSHIVSALVVVFTEGQKRVALNMLWEWVGLGVSFFLLRQTIRTQFARQVVLLTLVSTAVPLAGLGLWQHYYWYPNSTTTYDKLRNELDRLLAQPVPADLSNTKSRAQQIGQLQWELERQGIPLEGRPRILWEQRLRASSEPFGMFALANSFASFLIVGLIISLGMLSTLPMNSRLWFVLFPGMLLMVFCLVLTKSRTAWVGIGCGVAILGWHWLRCQPQFNRRQFLLHVSWVVLIMASLFAAASVSGGFDWAVVSQSQKSLKYRLEYWTGAWNVIRERPWLGTGPGNFRQHYLKHKLPESSEEVTDPHNLILDVWANSGFVGVIGLAAVMIAGFQMLQGSAQQKYKQRMDESNNGRRNVLSHPLTVGAAVGYAGTFVIPYLLGHNYDLRLLCLLTGFLTMVVTCAALARPRVPDPAEAFSSSFDVSNVVLVSASIALLVHLFGAGGIAMPAISQTLLVSVALASVQVGEEAAVPANQLPYDEPGSVTRVALLGGLSSALFVVCLSSSTAPVWQRKILTGAGDVEVAVEGNFAKALTHYRKAANADPLSPAPLERLAELMYSRWKNSAVPSEMDFSRSVKFSVMAQEKDPHNANQYRRPGNWFLEKFQTTQDLADARQAVNYLVQAINRYPNNSVLRSELARAYLDAGLRQQAHEQAQRALRLDKINRTVGHVDKYLPANTLLLLQSILGKNRIRP